MDSKDSKHPSNVNEKDNETMHYEDPEILAKGEHRQEQIADYSGATEKTDPVEIALVRKLDM